MLDRVPPGCSAEGKSVAGDIVGGSPLLRLPVDSLHCIASFLTPVEWSNLGQAGRGASNACREIFRRVRMHGFRCATEIVTAWVSLTLSPTKISVFVAAAIDSVVLDSVYASG